MSRITLRGFRPADRGVKQVLGKLEADVMQVLWQQPNQTVTEVEEKLRRRREIAHTTVLTTLDRITSQRLSDARKERQGFRLCAALHP